MAQIIKHRRGSISALKDVSANIGELVMGTGSIGDLNAPVLFIGDTAVAGGYKPVSKIYQGTTAPTISVGSHGSTMDGLPFYSTGTKTLYILDKGGNSAINLTGNIEGNTISGVTITSLTGSNANITNFTGSNGNFSNLTGTTFTSTNGNITSLTGSNANVTNITGSTISGSNVRVTSDMSVGGKVVVDGDISGSNLNLTGNATIDGNIVLKGNISIGDQTTDLVTFGADVSSSILPDVDNAFDLGSSEKNWRNLHVSGTAYVDTLEARQVNFTDLGVLEDLTVSGSTFLGNGGDITVVSGSLYNDQLTNNRVVIVGSQGLLEDDANFTFDGSKLNIGVGSFEVDTDGDVRTSGSLLVKNSATVTGSLNVSGSTNLVGPVDVNGDTKMTGSLNVTNIKGTGSLYLQPDQADGRYLEIYNTGVSGDVHVKSNQGLSFFGDDTNYLLINDGTQTATIVGVNGVFISSSLNVTGSSILSSTLEVKGATGLNSTLDVTGSATLKSTLQVDSTSQLKGAVGMNSSLDVTGSAQFKSTINVDSEATLASATVEDLTQDRIVTVGAGGSLIDSSGFTYNGTVFKIGNGQFEVDTNDGDVRTSGSLTTNGLTNNGDLTVNGVLTVTGNTQLQANLYVSGNLEVLGSSTNVIIQSQTVEIDDNIIRMNAYSPFLRYAGFEVMDSGSSGISSSVLWDSQNDYWLLTDQNNSGSKFVGTTFGEQGSEVSLTSGTIPKATSANTIGDSLLTENSTTLSYNTNKFQVTASDGATLIAGNVTVSAGGGADAGTKTSQVVFRNSSNVLGYVSATESTDVLDGILGYKNADGALKFSTVIDGGTY
jgi:cytoskeletal protein CcmA (bactofilin family)